MRLILVTLNLGIERDDTLWKGEHSQLTQERINLLKENGFVWEVTAGPKKDDTLWERRLKELIEYKQNHGNCLVPRGYELNANLGIWVMNQRMQYKKWLKGEHSRLTQERINLLEDNGFVWEISKVNTRKIK